MVFGADGDRDTTKRGEMGAIAARGADALVITDFHPRWEDPAAIRAALIAGARHEEAVKELEAARRLAPDDLELAFALGRAWLGVPNAEAAAAVFAEVARARPIPQTHVLIGRTYVDADGEVVRREQNHGSIVHADDSDVRVRLHGTEEEISLPPDRDAFREAERGEYVLRETGDVAVDPDLLATWTIGPPTGD